MFKHPENTMAVNPKTLDFSALSEFSVGTAREVAFSDIHLRLIMIGWRLRCAIRMDKDTWRFVNTFSGWASASATVAAVIVAIWGDRIRALLFKPRLLLRLYDPRGQLVPQ